MISFKDGDSSDLFKGGKSSAFKMADCPFYSQAQLAYKEGPLLKERGCEVERVSLKGKRDLSLRLFLCAKYCYVCE